MRHEAGFTLVEVLVSLAIFSLAIVGLNRAATLAVSGTADLQVKTHAGFVADNAVVLSRIAPLEVGTERSQAQSGGMAFDIITLTSETEQARFFEVLVRVSERDQERVLIERRAFRIDEIIASQGADAAEDPPGEDAQ